MANLAMWLLGLATPLAKQVLVGLGFGFATYLGIDAAFNTMVQSLQAQMGNVPPNLLVYAKMSGIIEAMGLILAAISFKLSLSATSKLMRL